MPQVNNNEIPRNHNNQQHNNIIFDRANAHHPYRYNPWQEWQPLLTKAAQGILFVIAFMLIYKTGNYLLSHYKWLADTIVGLIIMLIVFGRR